MFNAPRSPSNRYGAPLSNGLLGSSTSIASDPLVASAYIDPDAGLDPWSTTLSPAPLADPPSALNAVLGDAQIPALYTHSFNIVDTTGGGTVTINALQRVLTTSGLPAADIDKIVNLVSSRPRVSKMEFFVALALTACAQANKDVSIENVASLARTNELPVPNLDTEAMNSISSSTIRSTFPPPQIVRPTPGYNPEADPWTNASRGIFTSASAGNAASSILSTGLPSSWWKNQESITVTIHGQAGYIFNRYTLYQLQSFTRGTPVQRRYSEFVFLWDCLVKRYPFRILVGLPPKRLGPDEGFIEQRRKGLQRFLNYVVNHPVIKEDGLLAVFLSEPDFESWRRHTWISLDEESTTKRVESVQEMSIPSDLEAKLASTRQKIGALIEQWTRLCSTAERVLKRREAAAGELARVTMTMNALAEGNQSDPWGNVGDELASGVNSGVLDVAMYLGRLADAMEGRSRVAIGENLEALKAQRDLYIAVRDLFFRHDRLAHDNVDKLRKRIDTQSLKLESIKASVKEGWEVEADKLIHAIERDQATIQQALARRVFIRWCMWHEFRVVLRNRENTLLTLLVQTWTVEERDYSEAVQGIWSTLVESVESMPLE